MHYRKYSIKLRYLAQTPGRGSLHKWIPAKLLKLIMDVLSSLLHPSHVETPLIIKIHPPTVQESLLTSTIGEPFVRWSVFLVGILFVVDPTRLTNGGIRTHKMQENIKFRGESNSWPDWEPSACSLPL